MWRSLFMAVGVMAIIVGFETMLIDSAGIYAAAESSAGEFVNPGGSPSRTIESWSPGEKFPWAFLAIGTVVIMYAINLPKRWHTSEG